MKIYQYDNGHMTKIAMPIYGINLFKNLLPWNRWVDFIETWSNDISGLTLTYFMASSKFAN